MSIRVKLYMSYLAMVILPFILMLAFIQFIYFAGGKEDMRQYFEVEESEKFSQALIYGELSYVIDNDSDKLRSDAYLDDLQNRLGEHWAGLLIFKEGKIVSVPKFLKELSPDEDWQKLSDTPPDMVTLHVFRFETDSFGFEYEDGSDGKLVLLRRYEAVPIFWRPVGTTIALTAVALTSLLLTYSFRETLLSRSRS